MDKAFDVRAESRLGCQAKLGDEDVVVEISEESLRAWIDENPEERKKEAAAKAAAGARTDVARAMTAGRAVTRHRGRRVSAR